MGEILEFKEGKVFIEGEEFTNPQIIGELILSMAKNSVECKVAS